MRVVLQILPPGVQHTEEADLSAQVLGVRGDLHHVAWLAISAAIVWLLLRG
jgi:hypothetical protein